MQYLHIRSLAPRRHGPRRYSRLAAARSHSHGGPQAGRRRPGCPDPPRSSSARLRSRPELPQSAERRSALRCPGETAAPRSPEDGDCLRGCFQSYPRRPSSAIDSCPAERREDIAFSECETSILTPFILAKSFFVR